jgi:XRE family aerobic/anaerobic benzoate catabolism transcriptional regulator
MARTQAEVDALPDDEKAMLALLAQAVTVTRWEECWSRRQLAIESGLSERFIADVEGGRANPSLASLAALAKALALNVPDMLSGRPHLIPRLAQAAVQRSRLEQEEIANLLEAKGGSRGASRRVALLGLRGAGKTTVGKLLAKQLSCPFVELDRVIEDTAQLGLSQIFELHGDAYYRRVEGEVLRRVVTEHADVVIATGGGLVSTADTYQYLRERCRTVWLKTKPEEYLGRVVKQGDKRPMERRPQALIELKALLAAREPAYKLAELTVETTGVTPEAVTRKIASWLDRVQKPDGVRPAG